MSREEKIKLAIDRGYVYDPESGIIHNKVGESLNSFSNGYNIICLRLGNKQYSLRCHQFAYYVVYNRMPNCIDHINGIKTDNRILNLREVTKQQNAFNTKAKGYTLHKPSGGLRASIMLNGKRIGLGYFTNEEDAHNAYLEAKKKYHIIQ
jgi:hypothetical protein